MKIYKVQPLDLMQYINVKYHEPFIHELIEFEEKPNRAEFAEAIERLLVAFPLLKCRYDGTRNVFAENERLTVDDILKTDDEADRTALLTESLDTDENLIRFTLSGNALVVTVSHMVCDGGGFKKLLYLLCDCYNGPADGDFAPLMNRDFSFVAENLSGRGKMVVKMLLSTIGNYKNDKIYDKSASEKVFLTERVLARDTMSAVYAAAKKRGATLNDVFMTAYARAISKRYKRRKVNIPCTVDLRKYAERETGIANLTGTYNLNVKIDVNEGFAESLCDVTRKMNKNKKSTNDVAGPMLLVSKYETTPLDKFLKIYGGMNTSPFTDYTNLGAIDEKKLVFNDLTVKNAVVYGGLNRAPYFSMAVSSFGGTTTLSGVFSCGETAKKEADLLLDKVASEIKSFAK